MTDDTDTQFDLDGLRFRMVSSTASRVDPESPTEFTYHQDGPLLWGEYLGDTVTRGRFVGTLAADELDISFAHARRADGSVVHGRATSRVERRQDALLYLVESFEADGVPHESVCVQV
ncbi:hypothetical protein [Ruania alba]|uniref:Uncharacterized protein n=1 Tax=Ruania alba TaxID=648782 RepID=A0A1H5NGQ3_9MICO|nr:hypothetical protein [Ruania alba]SEF00755.1 hypothetical protein SAMN04488554_4323 [Ruania alba]